MSDDAFVEEDETPFGELDHPRTGWEESFAEMHARGDDVLLWGNEGLSSSWDEEEWEW
ncbi:MAG TPA: hypothetical protein VF541_04925 [Longimicrobium sp.]|jgi:hypothetical protein